MGTVLMAPPGLMLSFLVIVVITVSLGSAELSVDAARRIVTMRDSLMLPSLITLTTAVALPPGVSDPLGRATDARRSVKPWARLAVLVVTEMLLLSLASVTALPVSASAIRK